MKLFKRVSTVEIVVPAFVFVREDDVEASDGYLLAGRLVVDIPEYDGEMRDEDQGLIDEVLLLLSDHARLGRMPKKAYVVGWWGGARPSNAIDTNDNGLMSAWAADRMSVEVRIGGSRGGGHITIAGSTPKAN
jgi:hypothetical protein